jgi:hypothetical protein
MKFRKMLLLLGAVVAFALPGFAQIAITSVPTTCTSYSIFSFSPQSTAYLSTPGAGTYICLPGNQFLSYPGGGGGTQILLSNYTNATATASTVITFPMLANTVYQFSCTLFWQNSGANATVFTLVTPASPTNVNAFGQIITSAAGAQVTTPLSGNPLAITATAAVGATTYKAIIDGTIQNVTAGNLLFQGSATAGTITILNGSYCSNKSLP